VQRRDADVVVIGAGIVGLASARALLERHDRHVVVLDKEPGPAHHQTGRNSGVIHSGLYYRPDSGKRSMVLAGRRELLTFATDHAIPHELCGKVVVALDGAELERLDALEVRAGENGVPVQRLDRAGLVEREPHVAGVAALLVPSSGIIDYAEVCRALAAEIVDRGAEVRYGHPVERVDVRGDEVVVHTGAGPVRARSLVNCAGLHSDRVATAAGADTGGIRIMPFRGEYYELAPHARHLVNHLVYPLPDPAFPFLGVHLTRMVDGSIHAGPNAVPALAREGYRWRDVSLRDSAEVAFAGRTWRLARRYWRTGVGEIHRSLSRRAFLRALQRLCPDLTDDDLEPSGGSRRTRRRPSLDRPRGPRPDCFMPPKGLARVADQAAVQPDHAGLDPLADAQALGQVAGEDVGGQAHLGVVGLLDHRVDVVEGHDGRDRSEQLVVEDLGVGGHAAEHRRLVEVARPVDRPPPVTTSAPRPPPADQARSDARPPWRRSSDRSRRRPRRRGRP
jgi:(S)-2-hydroxyglutarate dehydrogenase